MAVVALGVGEGVGVGEGFELSVGVGVGDGFGEIDDVGVAEGVGFILISRALPLSQVSFFPVLTHVYFLLATIFVVPDLEHLVPAMVAEKAGKPTKTKDVAKENAANLLTRAISIVKAYKLYMVIW